MADMNEPLRECVKCHQPILVEVEGPDSGLCPHCRPKRRGRPVTGKARTNRVTVRLMPAGMAHVDEARGSWSRSEYVRRALVLAQTSGLKGPR